MATSLRQFTHEKSSSTNRKLIRLAATVASVLMMTACGADDSAQPRDPSAVADTSTTQSSERKSSTARTTSPSSFTAPESSTIAVAPRTSVVVVQPTLVECIYGGGAWTSSGFFSDGTYGEHPTCAALRSEQLAKYPYRCPQTDHQVADLADCGRSVERPELSTGASPVESTSADPTSAAATSEEQAATTESTETAGADSGQ